MSKLKRAIGFKGVLEAIKKGAVKEVIIDPERKNSTQVKSIIKTGIKILWQPTFNGVEAFLTNKSRDIDNALRKLSSKDNAIVLILDHLQDTGNFGSIIRSAAAFDVDLIIYPNSNSVQLTERVIEISKGYAAYLDIVSVPNIASTIDKLKESGFWIYGADASGDFNYKQKFDKKVCLVMGSEENGMKPKTKSSCDYIVTIPIKTESLNVSQACSIILSEIFSQKI
jgi:23S rRNA (guanosine2251-2'-O)-methyltransferase